MKAIRTLLIGGGHSVKISLVRSHNHVYKDLFALYLPAKNTTSGEDHALRSQHFHSTANDFLGYRLVRQTDRFQKRVS